MKYKLDEPIDFMKDYCEFNEDRVYILLGIARKRYNPELSHNSEIVYRKVMKDEEDIKRKYREITGMMRHTHKNFYLYVTVNPRNVVKGYFNYRNRMNEWVKHRMFGDENQKRKFKKVDSHWTSELQREESRDETLFLFDIDDKDIVDGVVDELSSATSIVTKRETPNGYHVVTEPYNYQKGYDPTEEYEDCERKIDGLLFLNFFEANFR